MARTKAGPAPRGKRTPKAKAHVTAAPATSDDLDVVLVLDQSTSMGSCRDVTISGFNEYVETLRKSEIKGTGRMTLIKFPSPGFSSWASTPDPKVVTETVFEGRELKDVPALNHDTYSPHGNTPLLDAVGFAITETRKRIAAAKGLPPKVILVIQTDGEENQSRSYTRDQIKAMVAECEAAGWAMVFLGANQDAWQAGAGLGISATHTMAYAAADSQEAFRGLGAATTVMYAAASAGEDMTKRAFFDSGYQNRMAAKAGVKARVDNKGLLGPQTKS
jgi:hypothetical protein